MNYEILKHIPPHLLREQRTYPFAESLQPYPPLNQSRVENDIANIPVHLVHAMPFDTSGIFQVVTGERKFIAQIVKGESMAFIASLRVVAVDDPRFFMDAHIRRPGVFQELLKDFNLPFLPDLPKDVTPISFDLIAKVDDRHHDGFYAKTFVPWAVQALSPYHPTHALAEWEPQSDNHAIFYNALGQGKNPVEAVKSTWTHDIYTQLGFELIPAIGITDMRTLPSLGQTRVSPHDNPLTTIHAMYKIK